MVRRFSSWRFNFKAICDQNMALARSTTYLMEIKFNHWYQWLIENNYRDDRSRRFYQQLMMNKCFSVLTFWRICSMALNSGVRKPLRTSLRLWILSSSLSARLRSIRKWKLRSAFNQFWLQDHATVRLHREGIYFATWRQVSTIWAKNLVQTCMAFEHCQHTQLSLGWQQWHLVIEQGLTADSYWSQASFYWQWHWFETWQETLTRQNASLALLFTANQHHRLSALSDAVSSWYANARAMVSTANDLAQASAFQHASALDSSWFKWLSTLQTANDRDYAVNHYNTVSVSDYFCKLRRLCKNYCSRLQLFESHLELNHPLIHSTLD